MTGVDIVELCRNPFGREADIGYSDESEEEEPSDGESVSDCSHSEDEESDESVR